MSVGVVLMVMGLAAHKLVWLYMARAGWRAQFRAVKLFKNLVLLALMAQPFLPPILPLPGSSTPRTVAGLILFAAGLAQAIAARVALGSNWSDIERSTVREGHRLVTHGPYRFVRHPLYAGDLMMLCGYQLALGSWLVLAVVAFVPLVLRSAAREEVRLAAAFPEYGEYQRRSKRFIPFLV